MNWYVVDKDGESTLCVDKDDAELSARVANRAFPGYAPHRAVQLVDAAEVDALKTRIAELERENAELRKDAERYHHLFTGDKVYSRFHKVYDLWDGEDGKAGFDAAIDHFLEIDRMAVASAIDKEMK
jgi:hypothetical protein